MSAPPDGFLDDLSDSDLLADFDDDIDILKQVTSVESKPLPEESQRPIQIKQESPSIVSVPRNDVSNTPSNTTSQV